MESRDHASPWIVLNALGLIVLMFDPGVWILFCIIHFRECGSKPGVLHHVFSRGLLNYIHALSDLAAEQTVHNLI